MRVAVSEPDPDRDGSLPADEPEVVVPQDLPVPAWGWDWQRWRVQVWDDSKNELVSVATRKQLHRLNAMGLLDIRERPDTRVLLSSEATAVITHWKAYERVLALEQRAAIARSVMADDNTIEWESGWEPGGALVREEAARLRGLRDG